MNQTRFDGRRGQLVAALALTLSASFALAGPAAAYTVISETGLVGEYSLNESAESPAATCGYGKEVPPNSAWFKWMKVRAPQVRAADRNSSVREHRHVTWQFKIQRRQYPADSAAPWQTVASSNVQGATAYEDQNAPFTQMKVYWNARQYEQPADYYIARALVIIKWFKPGGGVEGTVKLTPTYYAGKTPWGTTTFSTDYCATETTSG